MTRAQQINTSGVFTFKGDGTGTATLQTLNVFVFNPTLLPTSGDNGTCDLAYTIAADGSGILKRNCTGTTTAGGGAGNTNLTPDIQDSFQLVQGNRMALIGPSAQPVIESVTNTTPPTAMPPSVSTTSSRICTRSGVMRKLDPR